MGADKGQEGDDSRRSRAQSAELRPPGIAFVLLRHRQNREIAVAVAQVAQHFPGAGVLLHRHQPAKIIARHLPDLVRRLAAEDLDRQRRLELQRRGDDLTPYAHDHRRRRSPFMTRQQPPDDRGLAARAQGLRQRNRAVRLASGLGLRDAFRQAEPLHDQIMQLVVHRVDFATNIVEHRLLFTHEAIFSEDVLTLDDSTRA